MLVGAELVLSSVKTLRLKRRVEEYEPARTEGSPPRPKETPRGFFRVSAGPPGLKRISRLQS